MKITVLKAINVFGHSTIWGVFDSREEMLEVLRKHYPNMHPIDGWYHVDSNTHLIEEEYELNHDYIHGLRLLR